MKIHQEQPERPTPETLRKWLVELRDWLIEVADMEMGDMLRAKEDPSDIAQHCMLNLLPNLDDCRARTFEEFRNWGIHAAKNDVKDMVDHWMAQKNQADREVPLNAEPAAPTGVSKEVARRERANLLEDAMAQLTIGQRWIIQQRMEKVKFKDIAKKLGISVNAAKIRWGKAWKCLKAILEPQRGSFA